ncbi:MAG TPA: hypothetical protein VFC79_00255 [Tissierellaceae bacterium]|nr:hypothetical protein [Tissierellaceae bacterium]
MRGYPEHLHEVINEDLQESIYDETLEGEIIRDSQYSLEIMEEELSNKYISPEIKYAFKNSIKALEKQIPLQVGDIHGDYDPQYYCMICGEITRFEHQKYCIQCGQRLGW